MKIKVYALFDMKAAFFGNPFFCQSHGEAIRTCMDAASDMRSTIARYPADFMLHCIGEYDNETARLEPSLPEAIGSIASMLPRQVPLPLEQAADTAATLNGKAN